jgi:serine/threonine protein kinase
VTTFLSRGTTSYRAPEILESNKYNNRADIFALGCIIFELVTGQRLFSTDWAVLEHARSKKSIFPEQWPPAIPGSLLYRLGHLTSTLLIIEPMERPGASNVLQQLRQFQDLGDANAETNAAAFCDDSFFVIPKSGDSAIKVISNRTPASSLIKDQGGKGCSN